MKTLTKILVFACVAVAAAAIVQLASGESNTAVTLHVLIPWSGSDASCPAGYSRSTECHPHRGGPSAIPGLGFVSESYVFAVDVEPGPPCPPGFQQALSYPAQLTVEGRGEIFVTVAASDSCAEMGIPLVSAPQMFTITGGTGVFAGASGNGVVSRTNAGCCPAFATDNWNGTMTAAAFELDVTPPTISGAVDKVVRVPKYKVVRISRHKTKRVLVKRVRVSYSVGATDAVDANVKAECKPASGSSFRVGRATTVNCSATDTSANTTTAAFTVTVMRK